jgi:hypothetical protein
LLFRGRLSVDNPLFDGQGIEFHHLQRLDQRKQSQEIQKLLKEQNKLAAEQSRQQKGVCPCPHCGGGVPQVGVAVCMHCRRDLYWNAGLCGATQEDATKLANKARLAEQSRAKEKAESARSWEAWRADAPRREEEAKKEKEEKEHRKRMGLAGLTVGTAAGLMGILLPIAAMIYYVETGKVFPVVIAFVVGPALLWLGAKAGFWIAGAPSKSERLASLNRSLQDKIEADRDKIRADMRAHAPADRVRCPVCKAECRADRLVQHYDRQHSDKQ